MRLPQPIHHTELAAHHQVGFVLHCHAEHRAKETAAQIGTEACYRNSVGVQPRQPSTASAVDAGKVATDYHAAISQQRD